MKCYPLERLDEVVEEKDISIAIMTVPASSAGEVTRLLVKSGIRGILNFTTVPVKAREDVYLDEYDMITSLEKVAYFVKAASE